jgi:hypothetical protein
MLKTVGNPSTRYGDQTIVGGNLVIGTAGKGIDFSADSSAPGVTNELFDDYEEGSWTPTLGGTSTYIVQDGRYVKVGNLVYVYGKIIPSFIGTGSITTVSGLPFVVKPYPGAPTGKGVVGYFANLATSVDSITVDAINGTDSFYFNAAVGTTGTATNAPAVFQVNARVDFCLTYETT